MARKSDWWRAVPLHAAKLLRHAEDRSVLALQLLVVAPGPFSDLNGLSQVPRVDHDYLRPNRVPPRYQNHCRRKHSANHHDLLISLALYECPHLRTTVVR